MSDGARDSVPGAKLAMLLLGAFALVGVPTLLGELEPREHEVAISVDVEAPADDVYRRVVEIGRWPTWYPAIGRMVPHGERRFETRPDPRSRIDYVLREADGRSHAVIALEARPRRFGAVWTIDVTPRGSGARVRIHERGFIERALVRFLLRYVSGYDLTIAGFASALAIASGAPASQTDAGKSPL